MNSKALLLPPVRKPFPAKITATLLYIYEEGDTEYFSAGFEFTNGMHTPCTVMTGTVLTISEYSSELNFNVVDAWYEVNGKKIPLDKKLVGESFVVEGDTLITSAEMLP